MLEQRGVCREIVEVLSLVLVFSRSVFGADQTGAMMFTEEGGAYAGRLVCFLSSDWSARESCYNEAGSCGMIDTLSLLLFSSVCPQLYFYD